MIYCIIVQWGAITEDIMDLRALFQADLEANIPNAQITFTFGGDNYVGQRTKASSDRLLSDFDRISEYVFSIRTVTADWPAKPKTDDEITVDGVTYYILDVETDTLEVSSLIHLRKGV